MDAPAAAGEELRAAGWVTVAALEAGEALRAEARRLGCSHVLVAGAPQPVDES